MTVDRFYASAPAAQRAKHERRAAIFRAAMKANALAPRKVVKAPRVKRK